MTTKPTPKKGKARRDWKKAFLAALAKSPSVTHAARAAKVDRTYVYEVYKNDAEFAARWDDALEQSVDAAVKEAYRRAVEGTLRPVYQGGKRVGTIREHSDTLLIFLLKSHRPSTYRETVKQEHSGTIQVQDLEAVRRKRWTNAAPALASAAAAADDVTESHA